MICVYKEPFYYVYLPVTLFHSVPLSKYIQKNFSQLNSFICNSIMFCAVDKRSFYTFCCGTKISVANTHNHIYSFCFKSRHEAVTRECMKVHCQVLSVNMLHLGAGPSATSFLGTVCKGQRS